MKCTFHMLYFLLWHALADCYQVQLTGSKYVKRNEAIYVVCTSNQTPIGPTADFMVNGKSYTSLRSTYNGCYSAHLRSRCPPNQIVCHCDTDGKEYGLVINASERDSTMTILCLMKFLNGGQVSKNDSIIVNIYDPPSLRIKENVKCNLSTSVEIVCSSLGGSVIFDDWFHSNNGILNKRMTGTNIDNKSTISIGSCGIEDSGNYMCKAGYMIENETFWINITTNLTFYGPPIVFETNTATNPTIFTLSFYSPTNAIRIKWSKDDKKLENSSDFELVTNRHNISVDSGGVDMVLHGYKTSLTILKRLSGVYTVLLKNEFGEYDHKFSIPSGEKGFSLQTLTWILICIAVIFTNSTIATLTVRQRSRNSRKRSGNIGTVGIYYAAPSTTESVSQYNSTTPQNDTNATDHAAISLYTEIIDEQVHQEESDEISHQYIELE